MNFPYYDEFSLHHEFPPTKKIIHEISPPPNAKFICDCAFPVFPISSLQKMVEKL